VLARVTGWLGKRMEAHQVPDKVQSP
jgi:hypothetical protein